MAKSEWYLIGNGKKAHHIGDDGWTDCGANDPRKVLAPLEARECKTCSKILSGEWGRKKFTHPDKAA